MKRPCGRENQSDLAIDVFEEKGRNWNSAKISSHITKIDRDKEHGRN